LPEYPKDLKMAQRIEKHSRKAYGKPRGRVEEEIREGWGLMEKAPQKKDDDDDEARLKAAIADIL